MDKSLIHVCLIYCYTVSLYVTCSGLPRSIQFIRKRVGYHSDLDSYKIEVSTAQSLIACGRFGFEKDCTSLIYEPNDSRCTLYDVYMIGDGPLIDNYYVTNGAEETINIVGTCLTVTHNSSFTNVALGKTVNMSSVVVIDDARGNGDGWLLVDDNRDGFYPCAHTLDEVDPYIIVDLGQNFNVHSLYVLNRLDGFADRLVNLHIELGKTAETMREYVYHDGIVGDECTFVLDHVTVARYVRMSLVGYSILCVCELGIYSLI